MTTSAVTGKAAVITIGTAVAEANAFSVDRNTDAVEATSFDSAGNREYVAGLFGWSGSFTTLRLINKTGAQAAATFAAGATAGTSNPTIAGAIIITNEPIALTVDGITSYGYTFTGTGACTAATA